MRHSFRSRHQSVMFSHPAALGDVKSSPHSPHESAVFCLAEILPGNADMIQFAGSENPGLSDHAGHKFCLRNCHSASLQYVGILTQVPTHRKNEMPLSH